MSTALVEVEEGSLRNRCLEGNQDISVLGKNEEDSQTFTGRPGSLAVITNLPPFRLQLANISTFCARHFSYLQSLFIPFCLQKCLPLVFSIQTMAPLETSQLRFLGEAANLLASESPATAAHLFSVHTKILHDELKPLNIRQQKHHCGGCGSIRQSKCSQVTQVKPKAKSRAASKLDTTSAGGATVYKCLRCNQRTINPRKRGTSKPLSKVSSRVSTATASPVPTTTTSIPAESSALQALPSSTEPAPTKTADNANSKKRAKTRKQGGLQALLASKKNTQPSLDLFDFLQ